MNEDIRWRQRFTNYVKALQSLKDVLVLERERQLSELERAAKIKFFEIVESLAIAVLADYLKHKQVPFEHYPKTIVKESFNRNLIDDGQVWIDIIKGRNKAAHTYNESIAIELSESISNTFYSAFIALEKTFTKYYEQEDD